MLSPRVVRAYQDDERLRKSFNRLTQLVFKFDLEDWYQRGFWDERYVPVSYLLEGEIAVNVSFNRMNLLIDERPFSAIQIGTVMTHPLWRGRGLASKLMELVLDEYADECDFFFLFANEATFDWYPRFGFNRIKEYCFISENRQKDRTSEDLQQLDLNMEQDCEWLHNLADRRIPPSKRFGVIGGGNLLMYHALYLYRERIYRIKGEDIAVIAWRQDSTLHLVDVISAEPVTNDLVFAALKTFGSFEKIAFHFTPDLLDASAVAMPAQGDDTLFVYPARTTFPKQFYRQETGVA